MAGNRDGLRSLAKYSAIPVERFKYVADAHTETIQSVHCGIVYLMAFWSGPSALAFSSLTRLLGELDPGSTLDLIVVDVDGSPELYDMTSDGPESWIAGVGETLWIFEGQI